MSKSKKSEKTDEVRCYVCHKTVTTNQLKANIAFCIGEKFGEKLYRHRRCEGKLIRNYKKIRKVWKIDPRTRFKKEKKKKRRRDKQKIKEEQRAQEDI